MDLEWLRQQLDALRTQFSEVMAITFDFYTSAAPLIDELTTQYLEGSPEDRDRIRVIVREYADQFVTGLLFEYIRTVAVSVEASGDIEMLRKALAAASIENIQVDYRDSITRLADLFVRAERAGIDPKPYFSEISKLSSNVVPTGGPTSMQDTLAKFHQYAVVNERRQRP